MSAEFFHRVCSLLFFFPYLNCRRENERKLDDIVRAFPGNCHLCFHFFISIVSSSFSRIPTQSCQWDDFLFWFAKIACLLSKSMNYKRARMKFVFFYRTDEICCLPTHSYLLLRCYRCLEKWEIIFVILRIAFVVEVEKRDRNDSNSNYAFSRFQPISTQKL